VKLAVITGRKEHAARINEAWQRGVNAVIETAMRIIDAREGLEHGEYIAMIEKDLHFSARTAQRLLAIASNKVLSKATHASHLPTSWDTLYNLTVVANKGYDLEAGIASGAIHPKMQRRDVKALLPAPPQRDDDLEEDAVAPEPADTSGDGDDTSAWKQPTAAEAERLAARLIELDREAARTSCDWITFDERHALKTLCRVIERELVGTEEAAASASPDRWSDR
jgi:Protein of unknown function (DUF3102)